VSPDDDFANSVFHRNHGVFLLRRGPQNNPHHVLDEHISSTGAVKSTTVVAALKVRVGSATQTIGVSGKPIYQPSERIEDSSEVPQVWRLRSEGSWTSHRSTHSSTFAVLGLLKQPVSRGHELGIQHEHAVTLVGHVCVSWGHTHD